MNKMSVKPNVYEFKTLSEYLRAIYQYRKAVEQSFSYEKWAGEMGIKSRSYLRYLALGEKPPTLSIVPALLQGLKLNDEESTYLLLLVNCEVAPSHGLKALYLREIFNQWTHYIQEIEVQDLGEFLADPLIPQLFTYLSFEDASSDPETWARDFDCELERIDKALKCLIWQKLVDCKVREDGTILYRAANSHFKVPSEAGNGYLKAFHTEGIRQAYEAAQGPSEKRKLYSTFVALSPEQYQKAQALIQEFNGKMLAVFDEKL
ncbi:MAG: TIGR02147 family protein, partial [Bdellovibrio sp.]|nr:TIGR02147 family protein [Bdellovibrio sp.]